MQYIIIRFEMWLFLFSSMSTVWVELLWSITDCHRRLSVFSHFPTNDFFAAALEKGKHSKTFKIYLSKSTSLILKSFCTNVPWVALYQDCSWIIPICWNVWPPGGGSCFPYMRTVKNLRQISCQNVLAWFEDYLAHISLCDPLPRLF